MTDQRIDPEPDAELDRIVGDWAKRMMASGRVVFVHGDWKTATCSLRDAILAWKRGEQSR